MKNMNLNTGFDANIGKRLAFFAKEAPEPGQNTEKKALSDKIDLDELFTSEFGSDAEKLATREAEQIKKLGSIAFEDLTDNQARLYSKLLRQKNGVSSNTTPDPELGGLSIDKRGSGNISDYDKWGIGADSKSENQKNRNKRIDENMESWSDGGMKEAAMNILHEERDSDNFDNIITSVNLLGLLASRGIDQGKDAMEQLKKIAAKSEVTELASLALVVVEKVEGKWDLEDPERLPEGISKRGSGITGRPSPAFLNDLEGYSKTHLNFLVGTIFNSETSNETHEGCLSTLIYIATRPGAVGKRGRAALSDLSGRAIEAHKINKNAESKNAKYEAESIDNAFGDGESFIADDINFANAARKIRKAVSAYDKISSPTPRDTQKLMSVITQNTAVLGDRMTIYEE